MASLAETGEIEVEFLDFPDKWQVFQFEEDSELVVIESEQGHSTGQVSTHQLVWGGASNVLGHYIVKCTVFLLTTVMELCHMPIFGLSNWCKRCASRCLLLG